MLFARSYLWDSRSRQGKSGTVNTNRNTATMQAHVPYIFMFLGSWQSKTVFGLCLLLFWGACYSFFHYSMRV